MLEVTLKSHIWSSYIKPQFRTHIMLGGDIYPAAPPHVLVAVTLELSPLKRTVQMGCLGRRVYHRQ